WKKFHARNCFRRAKDAANHIFNNKMEPDNPLFAPLITAIHVSYGSPFTNWDGVGGLDKRIVPREYLALHTQLMNHRNKVHAHKAGDAFHVPDVGPAVQVRARVIRLTHNKTRHKVYTADTTPGYQALPPIITLCEALEKKMDDEANQLWERLVE